MIPPHRHVAVKEKGSYGTPVLLELLVRAGPYARYDDDTAQFEGVRYDVNVCEICGSLFVPDYNNLE